MKTTPSAPTTSRPSLSPAAPFQLSGSQRLETNNYDENVVDGEGNFLSEYTQFSLTDGSRGQYLC